MFKRFNIDIKTQRIILSFIALGVALLIAFLQGTIHDLLKGKPRAPRRLRSRRSSKLLKPGLLRLSATAMMQSPRQFDG